MNNTQTNLGEPNAHTVNNDLTEPLFFCVCNSHTTTDSEHTHTVPSTRKLNTTIGKYTLIQHEKLHWDY